VPFVLRTRLILTLTLTLTLTTEVLVPASHNCALRCRGDSAIRARYSLMLDA